jgi:tRNA pseudouridine55 synthase
MSAKPISSGILLVDKEPEMTSFDCIRVLKRLWRRTDLGHGGTLDRFASGLLPVLAGEGLKLARFFLESYPQLPTYWKRYEGTFELGRATETGDPEGETIESREPPVLSSAAINEAMRMFVEGPYDQTPPRYSAKKISGERASDLARKGEAPELKPVRVQIRSFRATRVEGSRISFEIECSKGTYVRALASDLAAKLDTVGHLAELRRTGVGTFSLAQAHRLAGIEAKGPEACLLDMAASTSFLPAFPLLKAELDQLRVGRTDSVGARLANSGLDAGVYCATAGEPPAARPVALFELSTERRATFLRAFV